MVFCQIIQKRQTKFFTLACRFFLYASYMIICIPYSIYVYLIILFYLVMFLKSDGFMPTWFLNLEEK